MAYWNSWGQPFLQSYRQPAPKRLSYEELADVLMGQQMEMPERPGPVSARDLEDEDRKRYRQQSLWAGLAGMGALLQGDQRGAMNAMGDIDGQQQAILAEVNQRREVEYQRQVEAKQREIQQQGQRQKVAALYGMMEEVADGETPAFVARAENAARAGSMAELEKMREEKPKRAFVRSKGFDPDAWDANQRAEADLKAEIERLTKQREWEEVEKKRITEEAKIKADAELASRIAQDKAGVLFQGRETPEEAAAKAEAVERVRAKYNTQAGGALQGRWGQSGGKWGMLMMENGKPIFLEADGQPEDAGGGLMRWTANGVPFVMDKDNPTAAYEVPMHSADSPEAQQFMQQMKGGKPAAGGKSGDAYNPTGGWTPDKGLADIQSSLGRTLPPAVQAEIRKDLAAGRKPREIMAEILRDNPQWKRK